ncbi:MAG TPA: HAD family phosphatase [Candidatus Acetothermia bacterium]|nr:HAD family phosphatase [Candidatus Acetothermia bacterium]
MKLVISDLGGVVVDKADPVPDMAARLELPVETFRALTAESTRLLLAGMITAQEFWARFFDQTGRRVEEDLWEKEFRPVVNPAVLSLVEKVRRRVRVVAGTNTMEPHWPALQKSGVLASFDAVYASHHMGLVKPDPHFYWRILREEECRPGEAVFFDDVAEHVRVAREIGMVAFPFRKPEDLERRLSSMGLLDGEL